MNEFIIKNFRKKECIKVFLVNVDKRISVHYTIPSGNKFTVKGMTFHIIEEKLFYNKGIPSFICSHKSAEPINPNDVENISMSPSEYNTAISAQIAKEIFAVTNNKIDMQMISLILSGLCIVGLILVYMTFSESFTQILGEIQKLTTQSSEVISTTGGY